MRPERILLLTFSRRAAREMLSRAERVERAPRHGHVWGGTFHAVANRLLRLHGRPLGLRPDFTVLDQADAADVMNLLREELGFAAKERRFPRKDTLASIYSRTVNAGEKLGDVAEAPLPVVHRRGRRHPAGVPGVHRPQARRRTSWTTTTCCCSGRRSRTSPQTREQLAAMFDHVLVDEYQDTNALQADILEGMRPADTAAQPHGGRRRRAVDLRVPRRDRAQHPGVPRRGSPAPP